MGTRADFYIGCGENAEWIGSIAWGGDEFSSNTGHPIMKASTENEFRDAVVALHRRDDFTKPSYGWPWPWETSALTDYVYWFDSTLSAAQFSTFDKKNKWPDMTKVQKVNFGSRSGVIILG